MSVETDLRIKATRSAAAGSGSETMGTTILVVDDAPINRELLRTYLLKEGYKVLEAEDGLKALDVLAREKVDLVLLDVMMPHLNGFATCARIKVMPRELFLPVILVTALDDRDSRNRGLSAGADDFLSRPVDRNELMLRVRAFLKIRRHEAVIQHQVKRLTRLQSLKDDLVTFIFNDLRNPLAGVDGCLRLLQSELKSPSFAPLLADVNRAAAATARVHSILDDVLDVRLLEDEELTLRLEVGPVRALVAAAVATLEGSARSKGIEVRISVEGEPVVEVDRTLVRRAVENLVANAIRHSAAGEAVSVDVRLEPAGAAIEVSDHGPPIPEDVRAKLFGKFGLLDDRQGAQHRGPGVGLYMVKLVADLHGGTASVGSRSGGGSTFRLLLPRVERP